MYKAVFLNVSLWLVRVKLADIAVFNCLLFRYNVADCELQGDVGRYLPVHLWSRLWWRRYLQQFGQCSSCLPGAWIGLCWQSSIHHVLRQMSCRLDFNESEYVDTVVLFSKRSSVVWGKAEYSLQMLYWICMVDINTVWFSCISTSCWLKWRTPAKMCMIKPPNGSCYNFITNITKKWCLLASSCESCFTKSWKKDRLDVNLLANLLKIFFNTWMEFQSF